MTVCPQCQCEFEAGVEPDPCVGVVNEDIRGMCCGHGDVRRAFVTFDRPGRRGKTQALTGSEALRWLRKHGDAST